MKKKRSNARLITASWINVLSSHGGDAGQRILGSPASRAALSYSSWMSEGFPVFNSHPWRHLALVNPATLIVTSLAHLLIFFLYISFVSSLKKSIILWQFNHLPPLAQLLLSSLVLPQCDPFEIYPVGLLICRPCAVEDESNVFLLKVFKS